MPLSVLFVYIYIYIFTDKISGSFMLGFNLVKVRTIFTAISAFSSFPKCCILNLDRSVNQTRTSIKKRKKIT